MKRLILVMTFLAACGDAQGPGWQIDEPDTSTTPANSTTEHEAPNNATVIPEVPVRPANPMEPIEIEEYDNASCETPYQLSSGERVRQTLEGIQPTENCLGWEMRQRYFEVTVPPNHRGWIDSDMVIYRHAQIGPDGPIQCSGFSQDHQCWSDYVNQTEHPITYLVAATEYQERVGEDFTIAFEAVPIEPNSSCEQRLRITHGQSHIWDVRGGWDTSYNPCHIIERHDAFYFHLEFPPNVTRLSVTVLPVDQTSGILPSIQVVEDMIAQYYPQCGRSDFAVENGECIATDDAYFRGGLNTAEVIVERPPGFTDDPRASYLLIVNSGGWSVPSGDARMEIRVQALD